MKKLNEAIFLDFCPLIKEFEILEVGDLYQSHYKDNIDL